MNKIYSLLGIGLLSAATLSSCKEDVFIEGGDELQRGESQTYVAVASIRGYENTDKESSTRANVQDDGSSFMWNADDKVTLWNGTNGYDFTTINYDESEPSGNVEFAGNGNFEEGATVWGIYPKKDVPTSGNVFTFTLGDATQSAQKAELQNTMHMLAKGTVNGTTVTNLKFEHLTALYQFKFTNRRPDAYKVTKVVVSADAAIFPKTLTVSGEEKTYGDKSNSLTLSMTSLEMAKNEVAYGYLSFFPIADMTKDTELTFTATIEKVGDSSSTETIEKKGKISELYNAESVVAGDEYKYVAGKRYGISFMLVADLGYEETEAGKYLVKKEDGLINLASEPTVMTNVATVITLDADLDMSTKEAWVPVTEFKGALDGNGKTISGLTIEATGNDAGLFITNNGIIKNLTLKDVTVKQVSGAAGAFAAINTGTIQNCVIDGGALTVNGADAKLGAITGHNQTGASMIKDCKVKGNVVLTVAGGKVNAGGLAGVNGWWSKAQIQGSSIDKEVSFVYRGNGEGAIGGLVGWNVQGTITGCYSLMTITAFTAVNAGGLVGGNEGPVTASFAASEIVAKASGNIGGLVKNGGTLTGCYSTSVLSGTASVTICGISTGSVTANECYFMSDGVSNPGGNLPTSTKVSDAAALIDKIASMNQAIAGSGYKCVENTGTDSARVPLLIQPDE